MKLFLLALFVAFGAAQFSGVTDKIRGHLHQHNADQMIDEVHGWRLEEYQAHGDHLLLFINSSPHEKYCYVVHVSTSWEGLLDNEENVHKIAEEIFQLVVTHTHDDQPLRPGDLHHDYRDWQAAHECTGHRTYAVSYTPSFA